MIHVKVLSSGAWVKNNFKIPIQLPHEVEDTMPRIDNFYSSKHSGRKLAFHPLLSHGSMIFKSKLGKYELEVTSLQIAILSSWNRRPNSELLIKDLLLSTKLPEAELRKSLVSLTQNPKLKVQLLLTESGIKAKDGKEFKANTKFRVNRSFSLIKGGKVAPRGKVSLIGRLPLVADRASKKELDDIALIRSLRTQEAIQKILKSRKSVTKADLVSELVDMLKSHFLPSKRLINEQIDWLTERDYIASDPMNPEMSLIYKA